jgi:hypothetical protein
VGHAFGLAANTLSGSTRAAEFSPLRQRPQKAGPASRTLFARVIASRVEARRHLRAFGRGSGHRASPTSLLLGAVSRALATTSYRARATYGSSPSGWRWADSTLPPIAASIRRTPSSCSTSPPASTSIASRRRAPVRERREAALGCGPARRLRREQMDAKAVGRQQLCGGEQGRQVPAASPRDDQRTCVARRPHPRWTVTRGAMARPATGTTCPYPTGDRRTVV